uniref:NADH-ubiquinone oxidoreductase chain 2 n=1 Tax=Tropidothorax cruciger TaxID=1310363 RepID=A0A7T1TVH4_9HEMI|nr:NADH dehydrogenase subunit 2 [Tropidothorax cruciger]QPP20747.1 NADH dehydrogenase subunit 2 [Tropidothorax cruciger]
MNYSKTMFLAITIMSIMIILSSTSWLGMWMGMEMNLMSFIPLISKSKNKKSSQSMIIYFMVQSMGSIIFLFSILMNKFIVISPIMMNLFTNELMTISMLIKLGMAPFHSWMPEMMANMNWMEILLLATIQKLGPLFVLNSISMSTWVMSASAVLSAIIGSIGGIMFTSLRKILAYSSISHMSWMIMMVNIQKQWYLYLMIYSLLMLSICSWFYKNNCYFMNQMMKNSSLTEKLVISTLFLSLGGMPPLLGFLPKWIAIQTMMTNTAIMIMMIMIMTSMLTLFYYMRMISLSMLLFTTTNKWTSMSKNNLTLFMVIIVNLMMPMFLITNFI